MVRLLEHLADRRGYLCDVVLPSPDSDGIRVLALWGAPMSHEHDIGRALRFVADVQAAAGREEVRAGVTRSTVFAGFVGTRRQESSQGSARG